MVQLHIVVDPNGPGAGAGLLPGEIIKAGLDGAVCGDCPHRGKASGGSGACYTHGQPMWGENSMVRSHMAKGSAPFDITAFTGRLVRFGAYGDPAAVPFFVWARIANVALNGGALCGYTHAWRYCDPRFSRFCMASVDRLEDWPAAKALGYRSFMVRPKGTPKPTGLVQCPASVEAGKRTTCDTCLACGGTSNNRHSDVSIEAHGTGARRFRPLPLMVI
jgi:hypothetical protein